ncbi:MAG: bifunctional phosphopantothenoylcysteine decarboxylase/phosphopantothenate--cysteine ligase CoaBC [Mariprofundus sp.]
MLENKHILIGIGGGIAVYRVAELVRLLIKQGAKVRCVMTRSACEFVTPLTFDALTGEQTHTELFDLTSERQMGHIQLARWADAIVIAPATANLLSKLAYGIADDLFTTIMQVSEAPVLIAPAMNQSMWENSATKTNVDTLLNRGFHFSGPASGELACGETGPGRLNEPEAIMDALLPLLHEQRLAGQRWVINAGPTWERWDAVRLLTNRATGTLGALLANTAAVLGASVTLIAGPGTPTCSQRVKRIRVESAHGMLETCEEQAKGADIFVGTAAVSDFAFKETLNEKMKRGDTKTMQVELISNPDVVATIANMDDRPNRIIAFAAESSKHIEYARGKLERKGADAIIANDVANMGSDHASGWWITKSGETVIDADDKQALAEEIIKKIMELQSECR